MPYLPVDKELGLTIQRLRQRQAWSVYQLHRQTGVAERTLRDIEACRVPRVQERTLLAVCLALNIDVTVLLHPSRAAVSAISATTPERSVDVYVSAPMSSLGAAYEDERRGSVEIIQMLRAQYPASRVYCALEDLLTTESFHDESVALTDDLDALRGARRLLAIFPAPLVSSVLVEIGAALAIGIPTLILVKNRSDLPSLLQGGSIRYPLQIHHYANARDVASILKSNHAFFLSA